ncbi:hypothetical protein KKB40_04985 [Patescibacteria group bacterium]|nr:hypothetical protein [Patescibacteria group bacterium]
MKYYELTKEEKNLLKEVEAGEWVSVKNQKKALREARAIAKNTLNKTKNINIRLTERVLVRLKAKAIEEGIPYQTLASSVLHKFASR